MRILAIHAHPDDIEFMAAGTLAVLAQHRHSITIVTMTPGDCGSADKSTAEISRIRRREAAAAAAWIGAAYECAEFSDFSIFSDDSSRRRVVEILRRMQPELILTAPPIDCLCDHEATSDLVRDACFAAPAPNYRASASNANPPLPAIPHLYFMDPSGGVGRAGKQVTPDFVVDVERTFEIKKKMVSEHHSQRSWLLKQHGIDDYVQMVERLTRERGELAGFRFGEGFRIYKGHPYPQSGLLQQLLAPEKVAGVS